MTTNLARQPKHEPVKVALISYDWGEYCIRLASELAQEAQVCLLLAEQQARPHLNRLDQRVNFHPFNKPRLRQPFRQIRTIFEILRVIKAFNPDVIHIEQGHFWFNFALPLLRQYPLVFTIHDPRHHLGDRGSQNTPQKLYDFGFRQATQIIVHVSQMAQVVIDELGIPSEMIHVIPHIVLGDDTVHPHIEEDRNLILFFGRIWAYKGLEYLIRAEPLITAQVPNAKIIIAGNGEDFTRYRRMMVHPENFIVHNEYVSNEKRAELFRRASVVALPYVEATQSGVIPIAYAFKKPVVATEVGGLVEQIEHGQTGFLVPPCDENVLADMIVRLLQDKELRHWLGANGKQKLHTEWSAQAVAQKTISVYYRSINNANLSAVQEI